MTTLGVGENIMAAKGRAKKYPTAGLSDDRNVIIQRARSASRIQDGCRAISERAIKRILSPHRDGRWRGRFDLLFERRPEDKPIGGEIIFLRHVGEQIVADIELGMNVQIDEAGTNDFSGRIDHPVCAL